MGQSERGVLVNLSSVSGILSLSDNQRARVPMKGWPGTAGFDESSQELKVCQGAHLHGPWRVISLVISLTRHVLDGQGTSRVRAG